MSGAKRCAWVLVPLAAFAACTAVGLATFAATKNPLGLIVSTGVKLHDEKTGSATLQGKVQQVAAQIAKELRPRFEQRGWIAPQAS